MGHAADLAHRLGQSAETVCRRYLPKGRRQGAYWTCGDVRGSPGRSLYVRLAGERAGKWTDAATGEHGDLLDLIALSRGLDMRAALAEARHLLALPPPPSPPPAARNSAAAARRLFAAAGPVRGALAEAYLRSRGIVLPKDVSMLRFHPRCFYRSDAGLEAWPALIAAVTDNDGRITGVHRTWLDPAGGKAPVADPRRSMGELLGNAVRFGIVGDVVAAAEGIETALSLTTALPDLPVVAALSSSHLAAFIPPPSVQRLYVARDNDPAGLRAWARWQARGPEEGIDVRELVPHGEDFNADLMAFGSARLRHWVARQLADEDVVRVAAAICE